jgi:hypothetical protein
MHTETKYDWCVLQENRLCKKFAPYIFESIKIKGPAKFAHERRHWSGETFPPAAESLFLQHALISRKKARREIDLDMTSV